MWFKGFTLYLLLSLSSSGSSYTLLTVGPCEVIKEKASFSCSRRNLTSVPQQIWKNVTELDLSGNLINLEPPGALWTLRHSERLIKLNLSGNYLPLVMKQHFHHLPSLEMVDLSGCRVAAVEADVLQDLPRLKKLVIRTEHLEGDKSETFRWRMINHTGSQQEHLFYDALDVLTHGPVQRRLLSDSSSLNSNRTDDNTDRRSSDTWKYLVAVLVLAIGVSVLIVVAAKCKVVHRYLASYRHSRLNEADGVSQGDPANFEVEFSGHRTSRGNPRLEVGDVMEDDDGFIEDNYIQASEQERAEQEVKHWPEEEEDEDMEEFSIG